MTGAIASQTSPDYDVVIGVEVHVQLLTASKIFCGCSTAFRPDEPNTQTCPVCLGLPGALPVLNRTAFQLAVRTALGLNCKIASFTKWDRKQYFYPDLPKGYQISQFDLPFSSHGYLDVPPSESEEHGRRVRILRAHLEEDAGKNSHDESGRKHDSQVDLNRAGTPLVEIVSEPDLRSADETRRFLEELRLLLVYLGVSDCNMQEGSLRCDANVNLHVINPDGSRTPTPIVEVKNLNSFRFTQQAIEYEIGRQWELFQQTRKSIKDAPKSTRGFDANRGVTYALREKEDAADYRYFPDPDLLPVCLSEADQAALAAANCEFPASRRARFRSHFGLSLYDANVILDQGRAFADYYEQVCQLSADGKQSANWMTQEVLRSLNAAKQSITDFPISAGVLGALLKRVTDKKLTTKSAREIFTVLLDEAAETPPTEARIDAITAERGLASTTDMSAIDTVLAEVIARNGKAVEDYRGGKEAALGSLIGQSMKQLKGADAQAVRARLIGILKQG